MQQACSLLANMFPTTDIEASLAREHDAISSASSKLPPKEAFATIEERPINKEYLHYVRRGEEVSDATLSTDSIAGYDADQMRARTLLTYEEEKKLLHRIDWHIMPLCAIAFLLKNIDSTNVSTVKIMNTGTHQNILKQLGMSSDEYNFVSTIYYVTELPLLRRLLS